MRLRHSLATVVLGLALASTAFAQTVYVTNLTGGNEVPPVATTATGTATVVLNAAQTQITISCQFQNLVGTYTASHVHGPAGPGFNTNVRWGFVGAPAGWILSNSDHDGTLNNYVTVDVLPADVLNLANGLMYVNVHSTFRPGGEIRGQLGTAPVPTMKTTWNRVKALYR